MPRVYAPNPVAELHRRQWDGQHVVYDDATGDTHLLGELGVYLLDCLAAQPADLQALMTRYANDATVAEDGQPAARLKRALDGLVAVGLIEIQS